MKNKRLFLGIDTSNYTTSAALCDEGGEVVANVRKILEVGMGERGLRQSDAVFAHVKNLPGIMTELGECLDGGKIVGVGVSVRPRDAEGSYMPCFLAGRAAAYSVASTHRVPVYEFSHQAGHVMAAAYSSGEAQKLLGGDCIAFHVSGGTTEALLVSPTEKGLDVEIVARTADISAGQAIDRAGVMMGLGFPAGREMETLASGYTGELPSHKICVRDGECNLSGLENKARELYEKSGDRALVSAYVFDFIGRTLVALTEKLRERYPSLPVLYAGGVMSNKILQRRLSEFEDTYFASPDFSADNAAGTALLARKFGARTEADGYDG